MVPSSARARRRNAAILAGFLLAAAIGGFMGASSGEAAGAAGASGPAETLPLSLVGAWMGEFFASQDLSGKAVPAELGTALALDLWIPRDKEPAPGVPAGKWSLRATARLRCDRAGTYVLGIGGDDGFRLLVDGTLVYESWKAQAMSYAGAPVALAAGEHRIVAELFEAGGGAGLRFLPELDGSAAAPERWKAAIYGGAELAGKPLRIQDWGAGGLDFDWGYGAPSVLVPANEFTLRAERRITIPARGHYSFLFRADDNLRFHLDGKLLLDQWDEYTSADRFLTPWVEAGTHAIALEFRERGGAARLSCSWRPLGIAEAELAVLKGQVRLPADMVADKDIPVRVTLATEFKDAFFVDTVIARGKKSADYSLRYPPQESTAWLSYQVEDPRFLRRGYYLKGFGTNHNPDETFRLRASGMPGMDLELIKPSLVTGRVVLPAGMRLEGDLKLYVQPFSPDCVEYFGGADVLIPAGAAGADFTISVQTAKDYPTVVLAVHCYSGGFVRHAFWDGKGLSAAWGSALRFDPAKRGAPIELTLLADPAVKSLEEEKAAVPDAVAREAAGIVKAGYTEFEKALVLYEFVCAKVRYASMPEYYFSESYGPLLPSTAGVGVCSGYAQYLVLLYRAAGLEAKTVSGGGHQWLQARINGAWYQLDPTKSDGGDRAGYSHFLESDEQIARNANNTWDRARAEPCPAPYPFDAARDMPKLRARVDGDYKRIFGTLALPAGKRADKPLFAYVNGYRFLIPKGAERVFFGITVARKAGADFTLKVGLDPNDQGLVGGFWDGTGLVAAEGGARRIPLAGADDAGVAVALGAGLTISGELFLPAGAAAPKGGAHAWLNVYDAAFTAVQWAKVEFREGERAAPFSFSLDPGSYALGLNGGSGAFPAIGFFNDAGMTPYSERARILALSGGAIAGIKLALESGRPIAGSIALPAGMVAPKGGSSLWIDAFDSSLRKLYWHKVIIPEGAAAIPFEFRAAPGWYYLRISCNDPRGYTYQNVGKEGVAYDFPSTPMWEAGSKEASALDIRLAALAKFSGTASLSGGRKAPKGGLELELFILLPSGQRVATQKVSIEEGGAGVPFSFDLMAGSYILGYRTKAAPASTAYYAGATSHPDWRRAKPIDARKDAGGITMLVE